MINDLLADSAKGTTDKAAVLPPEDLAQILTSIQTILQLYATSEEEDDIDLGSEDEQAIKHIADYLRLPLSSLGDENSKRIQNAIPNYVKLGLRLRPWRGTGNAKAAMDQSLSLEVAFSVRRTTSQASADALWPIWKLHKATWLVDERYSELLEAGSKAAKEYKSRMKEDGGGQDEGESTASYVLNIAEAITETALEQE